MVVSSNLMKLVSLVLFLNFIFLSHAQLLKICKIDRIFNLGDSISDTGNLVREVGLSTFCARQPYGESLLFSTKPTGRCSNGLLMIDYIAQDAGVPLLPPYRNGGADFTHGVNFAVAGSTALPWYTLAAENVSSSVTNSSLSVQLEWMSQLFNSTCHNKKDCIESFQNTLIMFGTIGGNDYNYGLFDGQPVEEVRSLVPQVINAITVGVRKVISYGAKKVVVPGNFPIGCLPVYKTLYVTDTSKTYDESQCLTQLNDFAKYHNEQLQEAIHVLRQENPNTNIVYADHYNAFLFLLQYAKSHGFDTQSACCGIGGQYNYNMTRMCGTPGVRVCPDPDRYMSWDGVHLTQEGYKIMSSWLLRDIFTKLDCHF